VFPAVISSLVALRSGTVGTHGTLNMSASACSVGSATELAALKLPDDQLREVVLDCPTICLAASGSGQPDLAGTGVCGWRASSSLYVSMRMLFG